MYVNACVHSQLYLQAHQLLGRLWQQTITSCHEQGGIVMRSGSVMDSKVLLLEVRFYAPLNLTCNFKNTYVVEENN